MTMNVDRQRLASHVARLAKIGAGRGGSVNRPSYSRLERQAHQYVADELELLGAKVTVDAAGNTLGILGGLDDKLPPILTGSHLDTVPDGGRYDGVVGVIAGLEALRAIKASRHKTAHPLGVVAFAGEEGGSRFGEGRLGSQMKIGNVTSDDLGALRDDSGASVAEAMRELGLEPERLARDVWYPDSLAAFIEVHIEQGKILEGLGKTIGVVTGIVGATRLRVTVTGRADHAGGTPMSERRDSLLAAAKMIVALHETVRLQGGPHSVGNVGDVRVLPGSVTVVPASTTFLAEFRDQEQDSKERVRKELLDRFEQVADEVGVQLKVEVLADNPPVAIPVNVQDQIRSACLTAGIAHHAMPSGGGHDAAHMAEIAPTGMIFIPCRDGVSHNPAEFAEPDDISTATAILAYTLVNLDADLRPK